MANNVFSLSINELHTKVAHLNYKKNKIELFSLGYESTIPNYFSNQNDKSAELEGQLISKILAELNITEKKVQIVLPDSMTYSQLVVMPELKEEELAQSIRLQVDEIIPLPISEINLDFEVINNLKDNKLLILLVAIEKKISDHIGRTLEFAKLEPESLENEISVLGRFITEVNPFIKESSIILNFGYGGSSLYVINPPFPYFQFTRTIKLGYASFIKDLKMNLNIPDAKAMELIQTIGLSNKGPVNIYPIVYPLMQELINEIKKVILLSKERFGANIKHIYLLNFDSQIAHFFETIQTSIQIPTMPLPINQILIANPITQSFSKSISSFIPVIAAHIR